MAGDWDGDGVDTVMALNPSASGQPVVGDWNGDGADDVAFYRDGVLTIPDEGSQRLIHLGRSSENALAGWWG